MVEAPDCLGRMGLRFAAVGQRLDDGAQVVRADPRAQLAHGGEAVVDAAAVDHPVGGGDNEGLRGHARAEAERQIAGRVHDDGERDPEIVHEVHARLPADVWVREDCVQRNAFCLRVFVELV